MADRRQVEQRGAVRVSRGGGCSESTLVAVEEPLEIRVAGDSMAVTMRTPGHDRELALGLLLCEGVIGGLQDVGKIAHCGRPGEDGYGNLIEVAPGPGVALDPEAPAFRRGTLTSSACGVCGRDTIADLLARCRPLPSSPPLARDLLPRAIALLSAHQPHFARTGGLHAAAAVERDGALLVVREDVGRHNAVDKLIGALLLAGELERAALLAVSGRTSFEIVQKAAVAGIAVVASISAPTSLAIDVAEQTGIALAGFVRGGGYTLYSHPERVAL
jgi:FdhD protein